MSNLNDEFRSDFNRMQEELDRSKKEFRALLELEEAVRELFFYEKTGGPEFLEWEAHFDSVRFRLSQLDKARGNT